MAAGDAHEQGSLVDALYCSWYSQGPREWSTACSTHHSQEPGVRHQARMLGMSRCNYLSPALNISSSSARQFPTSTPTCPLSAVSVPRTSPSLGAGRHSQVLSQVLSHPSITAYSRGRCFLFKTHLVMIGSVQVARQSRFQYHGWGGCVHLWRQLDICGVGSLEFQGPAQLSASR